MLSQSENAGIWQQGLRMICKWIDFLVYGLLVGVYNVFFNVANQEILNGEVVSALIGRLQLIVGIVFLFIFAVNIVQGIINPDNFSGESGTSKIIVRVMISLILLAAMIPLNLPNASDGSWEGYLKNQGVLFGSLSFFQNRVLETNVLGKLILGSSTGAYGNETGGQQSELASAGDYMAIELLKMFIFPNMAPDATSKFELLEDGRPNAICVDDENFYDAEENDGRYQYYMEETQALNILGYVDNECNSDFFSQFSWFAGNGQLWQFQYLSVQSTAVGIFVVIMLLGFTVDVAVRVFKMVVLRVIGPIAAISYVMPNSSKNGMFNAWFKSLTSTYIEIFLRLAIVYFVIFVVVGLLNGGTNMDTIWDSGTIVGMFTIIFLIIGLFIFAKQAPSFIRKALGMPEDGGSGIFGGLASLAGAVSGMAALGTAAAGSIGAGVQSFKRSSDVDKDNGAPTTGVMGFLNRGKHLAAGITGGIRGGIRAGRAGLAAENHRVDAAMKSLEDYSLEQVYRGANHGTFGERASSYGQRLFRGYSDAQKDAATIKRNEAQQQRLQSVIDRAASRTKVSDKTRGSLMSSDYKFFQDAHGTSYNNANYKFNSKGFNSALDTALAMKRNTFEVTAYNSETGRNERIELSTQDGVAQRGQLEVNNVEDMIQRNVEGDKVLSTLINDANVNGGLNGKDISDDTKRGAIYDEINRLANQNTELTTEQKRKEANDPWLKKD